MTKLWIQIIGNGSPSNLADPYNQPEGVGPYRPDLPPGVETLEDGCSAVIGDPTNMRRPGAPANKLGRVKVSKANAERIRAHARAKGAPCYENADANVPKFDRALAEQERMPHTRRTHLARLEKQHPGLSHDERARLVLHALARGMLIEDAQSIVNGDSDLEQFLANFVRRAQFAAKTGGADPKKQDNRDPPPAQPKRVDKRGCRSCKDKLLNQMKKEQTAPRKKQRILILKRARYDKPFTRQLVKDLTRAGWIVDQMTNTDMAAVRAKIEGPEKPDALLRWEEHGCLFTTRAWKKFVDYLYRWDVAPLSMDLGYFAHYKTLMADRYRRVDAASTILDEFANLKTDMAQAWRRAPRHVREYREETLRLFDEAKSAGPIDDLKPGYVLVFMQFSAALARDPFRAKNMTQWARNVTDRLTAAGKRVVLKAAPIGPFPEFDDAPTYAAKKPVEAGEGIRVRVDPALNARLAAHCEYAVVNSSSVSNELVVWDVPVVALGKSWFNGLGVFHEPQNWQGVCTCPEIDPDARARWVNWWAQRQAEKKHAPQLIQAQLDSYRRDPYDYAALYNAVYTATPHYGSHQPRIAPAADAVADLKPKSVLDVGCGQGALAKALAAKGVTCHGMDVAYSERSAIPPERFRAGSALAIPAADNEFDVVTCMDMIEHLRPSDVPQALAEILRVAKRGAVFSVGCCKAAWPVPKGWPNLHQTVRNFDQWQQLVSDAGFIILKTEYRAATDNLMICMPGS